MSPSKFYIDKWFLDFTGSDGEAMIFYAAKLSWYNLKVRYTSWINYTPGSGVKVRSRFNKVHFPEKNGAAIHWHDDLFEVAGNWKSVSTPLQSRLFNSDTGYLDWYCYQPASIVQLDIKGEILKGKGYVERLVLTTPPWKIPMDELRWGRFHSLNHHLVWIEIRQESNQQWIWLNGSRINKCTIEDDHISTRDKNFQLELDRQVVLESGKTIYDVVQKILKYLPGFNKIMPIWFLMADSHKWLSTGTFQNGTGLVLQSKAIHEWVNFNA